MKVVHSGFRTSAVLLLAAILLSSCSRTDEADESGLAAEIRKVSDAYEQAINRADAAAATECWTKDGEFVNESTGRRVKGGEAILEALKEALAPDAETKAETASVEVSLVAPRVASAEGRARFTRKTGPVEHTTFVALYVKRDGEWKIHRVWQRELPVTSHYEHLEGLAWVIGEWSEEKDGKKTTNVCRWSKNRNFITRTFEVSDETGLLNKGTEVIGWDPDRKQVRSWTFDTKGGVADTFWRFSGGEWLRTEIKDLKPADLAEHRAALAELAWMVGRCVDRDDEETIETTCEWSENQAFLVQRFKASVKGLVAQEGIRAIGWDPEAARIRSWMFDTDGGFCESTWSHNGDAWLANNRHVLPDGRLASSVAVYKKVNDDTFTWRRVAQELDGELLPDEPEITVVREPAGN